MLKIWRRKGEEAMDLQLTYIIIGIVILLGFAVVVYVLKDRLFSLISIKK